jgi:hypothetical protein
MLWVALVPEYSDYVSNSGVSGLYNVQPCPEARPGEFRTTKMGDLDVTRYPDVPDPELVGTYPATAYAGGGFVWDEVLEYRVWCHPERGAPDTEDGNDYYYAFVTYAEALAFSQATIGAEEPLALIRQLEYIDEPNPGEYHHVKEPRITEWSVEFLQRPRRTPNTIPDFLSPNAPSNRLDILRGLADRNA